jgi:hypothetical protein
MTTQQLGALMSATPAAFGLYPSTRSLHVGAEALRAARFRQTDISVMYSDGLRAMCLRETEEVDRSVAEDEPASIGMMLSELSGVGAIAMRSDGPFMAAGPILATLAYAGAGLLASLRGLGIPESLLEPFECRLKQGGLLLSVQCDDDESAARARRILLETGAEQVTASG